MNADQVLQILQVCEKLKCTTRHCDSSSGRRESVAEHCWQMSLMAMLLEHRFRAEFPEADMHKVLQMCLIHDLGEAFTGDIPSFEKSGQDEAAEEALLLKWVSSFPQPERSQWEALYAEMTAQESIEAKIYKAMDKMEAVIQHNLSDIASWLPLEYALQRSYGQEEVRFSRCTRELNAAVDRMTEQKIARAEERPPLA